MIEGVGRIAGTCCDRAQNAQAPRGRSGAGVKNIITPTWEPAAAKPQSQRGMTAAERQTFDQRL
jgi:hypothetical protein